MRWWVGLWMYVATTAAACGRVGFEHRYEVDGDGSVITDSAAGDADDAADADLAVTCAAGDSVCRKSCLGIDPDCTSTCGDSTCVGNAGELCASCAECNTTDPVCGNGDCEPSEDHDICYADCGPSPWLWTAEEMDVLTRINTARAAGIDCPGPGGAITAPELTPTASLVPESREWAWELAHHQLSPVASMTCNGRTGDFRFTNAGTTGNFGGAIFAGPGTTPQDAVNAWIADTNLCPLLADPAFTMIGTGVAYDASRGFVVILD